MWVNRFFWNNVWLAGNILQKSLLIVIQDMSHPVLVKVTSTDQVRGLRIRPKGLTTHDQVNTLSMHKFRKLFQLPS